MLYASKIYLKYLKHKNKICNNLKGILFQWKSREKFSVIRWSLNQSAIKQSKDALICCDIKLKLNQKLSQLKFSLYFLKIVKILGSALNT